MPTTLTTKGQVTIPKHIRESLGLVPGTSVDFAVNAQGQVVIQKITSRGARKLDRFDAARGRASVKWRTKDLMSLLRD